MPRERLQKLLAAAGVCSRRRAEDLLLQGRVRVNGSVAGLGDQADASTDLVELDGQPLRPAAPRQTLLLHKPVGVVSSCHDPQGRPTVLDLLPAALTEGTGLHPVGRLDIESRGALLLTNDGALTLRLTHPRHGHGKTYRVLVQGHPSEAALAQWRRGVALDGEAALPVQLRRLRQSAASTLLEVKMREGRNRQIRRTAALLGHPVLDLLRVAIGDLQLGTLPPGQWRPIDARQWFEPASGAGHQH
jgi:pseudouridine synthase